MRTCDTAGYIIIYKIRYIAAIDNWINNRIARRNRMRKFIALGLAMCIGASALTGCGKTSSGNTEYICRCI